MILLDVNVLVYAYRREAEQHASYAEWLTDLLAGSEEVGLLESVLTGFVRIATHRSVTADPAPTTFALEFVRSLQDAACTRRLHATDATWQHFADLAEGDRQIRGNLVPDAWIAAMARSHGARIATADRGFARFPGVSSFDPVA